MRAVFLSLGLSLVLSAAATPASAQCGGSFSNFVNGLKKEARAKGHSKAQTDRFFQGVIQDAKVLRFDRAQNAFKKNFLQFSRAVVSQNRIDHGAKNAKRYRTSFQAIERQFGIPQGVLLAFWALETDYGANQGSFNTLNALVTLSHDCRRPELFRPQVFAALELFERGDFDPATMQGAWAGEIGMVQMLPEDILTKGIDGDRDGTINLKTSAPDALFTAANVLSSLGWRAGEPWLQEITLPANFDWSKTGLDTKLSVKDWQRRGIRARSGQLGAANLQASVLLPMGRNGPAFLAYPNFEIYFEWNKSFVYVTSAAYFATRLSGAAPYNRGTPDEGLTADQMEALQRKLEARGHDVGGVDGILGAKTRAAVQKEQARLGLPADAWPTPQLFNAL
ncbi:MAG: lytic murein transglycosylase [Pseudomonadota bacterium]